MNNPKKHFRDNARRLTNMVHESFKSSLVAVSEELISKTPVDKHVLIGNWELVTNPSQLKPFDENPNDWGGHYAAADILYKAQQLRRKDKEAYILNNSPYMIDIEEGFYSRGVETDKTTTAGFSKQAPEGVVAANMGKYLELVEQEMDKGLRDF